MLICCVQVTKLCDLGIDDCVCSVGWAQRGTHLAVGTSNGKVQVRVYMLIVDHHTSQALLSVHHIIGFQRNVFDGVLLAIGSAILFYYLL